jgi:hypothetical protein
MKYLPSVGKVRCHVQPLVFTLQVISFSFSAVVLLSVFSSLSGRDS